jgi:putative intracellular protease/amidase
MCCISCVSCASKGRPFGVRSSRTRTFKTLQVAEARESLRSAHATLSGIGAAIWADQAGLVLPGGVASPDKLRLVPEAVGFVQELAAAGQPIAAICHGPWTLVEAGVVDGKTLTSWPSLQTDIRNAGGEWRDEEVLVCTKQGFTLVTSRKPDDIDAFDQKLIEVFAGSQDTAHSES